MRKIMVLCIFILAFSLVFSFGAGAVDYPFYSIEIDDDFYPDLENTDTSSLWSNDNGSSINISISPNSGIDFNSISNAETEILTKQIEATYENLELDSVKKVKGFKGEFCSRPSFNYTLVFSVNNMDYSVEGFIFTAENYLYTVETSSATQSDRDDINDMLNSFSLPEKISYDENDVVLDEGDGEIKFVSEDGVVSFDLPSGFVEQTAVAPLEKQWNKNDASISVAFLTMENTTKTSMINLSGEDLNEIAVEFAESAGANAEETTVENVTVNGYDGIKIKTKIKTLGLTADTDVYSFATADSVIFIYFYRYSEGDEKIFEDILNSLSIGDELLTKSGNSFIYTGTLTGALVGAIVGALVGIVLKKKKKKGSVDTNSGTDFTVRPQI